MYISNFYFYIPVASQPFNFFFILLTWVGDLCNQSYYFRSNATGLIYSSIEINNTPLM